MIMDKKASEIASSIKKTKAKKIFLQIPEGLKTKAQELADYIEGMGILVIISADPCYGACDIKDREAKELGCDLLVHIGHTEMKLRRKAMLPVLYEEYQLEINPIPLLKKHINILKPCKKACLVTTTQYIASIEPAKKFLEKNGKTVFIGQPLIAKYPGQILGCDYSAAEPFERMVDCFIFMGTGRFHPMGLAARVNKPVLSLDFEMGTMENMRSESKILTRIKAMQIEKARDATRFGILVSTKPGQENIKTAEKVKKKLEKKGKKAWILVMSEISPSKIMGMKFDILVNSACPRITEDFRQYKTTIINPEDVDKL